MILKALEAPNVEMKELIKQQRSRYESKSPLFLSFKKVFKKILTAVGISWTGIANACFFQHLLLPPLKTNLVPRSTKGLVK